MHNFLNLNIWRRAMDLTDSVFKYNQTIPNAERYNLIDQMNRSACSIPSNIAEGSGKRTKKQFAEFISIALSSSFELQTQLLICERRLYGKRQDLELCLSQVTEVQKMIFAFREKLEPKPDS